MALSLMLALMAGGLSGCESGAVVEGLVVDFQGQPLPGVAVIHARDGAQTITNALGTYRLRIQPGETGLEYRKTGYTPGNLQLNIERPRLVEANTVLLWPLPIEKGVYLFKDFRYHELERMEPEAYQQEDGSPLLALPRTPEMETDLESLRLLCYDMPPFDVRLHRLSEITARKPMTGAVEETVWGPVETISILSAPIDEPEQLLLEIDLLSTLQPGVYAVHWGALDGYTTLDSRCYVFRIADPEEDEATEEDIESEDNDDAEA